MYELVPEAYRQRFRMWKKGDNLTDLEFAGDLIAQFTHWCSSLNVNSSDDLSNLIVLEELKNSLPESITIYIAEKKVKTAMEAAALADGYLLTHQRHFGDGGVRSAGHAGPLLEWELKVKTMIKSAIIVISSDI